MTLTRSFRTVLLRLLLVITAVVRYLSIWGHIVWMAFKYLELEQLIKFNHLRLWHIVSSTRRKNVWMDLTYRIRSNYRTYPYKRTVKKFHRLQITACVLFLYILIKAYVAGTLLNCIDLSMQFKWVPTTYAFIKKIRKKSHNHHQISPFLIFSL